MSEEQEILKIVSERLDKAGVPYMVTGSISANYYTVPRMTRDIDIVIELQKEAVPRLFDLFKPDFYIDVDMVNEAVKERGMFNIIHNDTVMKVDFIVRKNSAYRKTEFERRRQVETAGVNLWIVSIEDLILSKLDWAKESLSERQLDDVRNLMKTTGKIDSQYLESWIKLLELEGVYKRVKT